MTMFGFPQSPGCLVHRSKPLPVPLRTRYLLGRYDRGTVSHIFQEPQVSSSIVMDGSDAQMEASCLDHSRGNSDKWVEFSGFSQGDLFLIPLASTPRNARTMASAGTQKRGVQRITGVNWWLKDNQLPCDGLAVPFFQPATQLQAYKFEPVTSMQPSSKHTRFLNITYPRS